MSYSTSLRLNFQVPGSNLNTWGTVLNTQVAQLLEDAIVKRVAFSLSGSKTLTSANGSTDEARCAFLDVTGGTGGTITAPSVEKSYKVRNGASGDVIVTTGAGVTATFKPGEIGWCFGDGTNFRKALLTDFGGVRITSVADPLNAQDAATRNYVDTQLMGVVAGNLPGQGGNGGKVLGTDGSTSSWVTVWRPTNLHLSDTSDATSHVMQLATSADVALGGVKSANDGSVGLVNASGADRLKTASDGSVTATSDSGTASVLATQDDAFFFALIL